MNDFSHGIDMVECARLLGSINRHGERFLQRVFTQAELDYCLGRKREIEHLAGRFAAKEAVLKVLGTGWTNGISWTDIEVLNESSGRPRVYLTGRCRQIADELGLTDIQISISHIATHAIASAIGVAGGGADR
ncbi:MAG TPA: holo-[acyl-carrier-protein] synthase [Phycisphaerae bacterium]|nr:holo-[acyl-carrier-protein] synthase [Phycisphaerae bacterium]HDZ44152.1 holo-[acyl-carrier-protein] synthase [Phycisphaerae bacterium]